MLNKKQIKNFHDNGYKVVNFINKKKLNLVIRSDDLKISPNVKKISSE